MKQTSLSNLSITNKPLTGPIQNTLLVVLDVSGVLCAKDKKENDHLEFEKVESSHYNLFIRPGAKEFILKCLDKYDVGIFSSTTYTNVGPILKKFLTNQEYKKLKFIWCRDRCTLDPDYGIKKEIEAYDTVKLLDHLIANPYINCDRQYTKKNVIMLDDSKSKMRFNDPTNYILVKSFLFDPKDNELEKVFLELESFKSFTHYFLSKELECHDI